MQEDSGTRASYYIHVLYLLYIHTLRCLIQHHLNQPRRCLNPKARISESAPSSRLMGPAVTELTSWPTHSSLPCLRPPALHLDGLWTPLGLRRRRPPTPLTAQNQTRHRSNHHHRQPHIAVNKPFAEPQVELPSNPSNPHESHFALSQHIAMAAVKASSPRSASASPASSPEATVPEQTAPVQKRKGGRKPVYATQEERKMRNRAAQAGTTTLYTPKH